MTTVQHLTIRQGATFSYTFPYRDAGGNSVDLSSGYSARMTIRRGFGVQYQAHFSTGSDADGGTLALDASSNIVISSSAEQTATLDRELLWSATR